jgi:hypothetical protein
MAVALERDLANQRCRSSSMPSENVARLLKTEMKLTVKPVLELLSLVQGVGCPKSLRDETPLQQPLA